MTKKEHRAPLHDAAKKILESCQGLADDDGDTDAANGYGAALKTMSKIAPLDSDDLTESINSMEEYDENGNIVPIAPVDSRESFRRKRDLRESRAIANDNARRAAGIPERIVVEWHD